MPSKPPGQYRKLYLGEWLARLNMKAEHVAKEVDIQPSYLSMLISGEKKNPSARLLLAISEVMRVSVNDLYRPPPPAAQLESLKDLSPQLLNRLLEGQRTRK
jgi:transcriptional regulator with XRE-family HTH domain